ncbi:MAG: hypothetical protein ACK6EB_13795, partial [Planctomyces sp.]
GKGVSRAAIADKRGPGWDGETALRTLADSTTTFHFARSQGSADSSFSPHAKPIQLQSMRSPLW